MSIRSTIKSVGVYKQGQEASPTHTKSIYVLNKPTYVNDQLKNTTGNLYVYVANSLYTTTNELTGYAAL